MFNGWPIFRLSPSTTIHQFAHHHNSPTAQWKTPLYLDILLPKNNYPSINSLTIMTIFQPHEMLAHNSPPSNSKWQTTQLQYIAMPDLIIKYYLIFPYFSMQSFITARHVTFFMPMIAPPQYEHYNSTAVYGLRILSTSPLRSSYWDCCLHDSVVPLPNLNIQVTSSCWNNC